ncbi:MAG: ribose-phosphate diphosphokinase [Bauldia sp.]|nr:ribose-phosphate diphosphokinase [Bauldia sp.]
MTGAAATLHHFVEDALPAGRLAGALGIPASPIRFHSFPDGESLPTVAVPGEIALVYRSLDRPDAKLFPLALAADALRRRDAREIVLVAPYLPYMRQDTVFQPGQPLSQSVFARFIAAHFDRLVTVDAHLHRTRSLAGLFAPMPAANLRSTPALAAWLRGEGRVPDLIVGPDEESEPWVRSIAEALHRPWLTLQKVRHDDATVTVTAGPGMDAVGRRVLLVDDICSTGGTLLEAMKTVGRAHPAELLVYVTHALFGEAVGRRLGEAGASLVFSSDSVAHDTNAVPLAGILAEELGAVMGVNAAGAGRPPGGAP